MKWSHKLVGLGLLAFSVISLGACSQEKTKSDNGRVTIEYFNQKKEMSATIKEIIKDFEKENPKIHVKVVDVPAPGEVLKTRMLAGDIPDVVGLYPQNIDFQEWAKADYFEDLTNKDYLDHIANNYASKYAVESKIYNVPLTANAYGFYYNKTAFKELGYHVPETWADFQALVAKMIKDGQTPFAIAGSESWTLNGYHQLSLATITGGDDEANQYLRFSKPNSISAKDDVLKEDMERIDLLRQKGAMQKNWQGAGYVDALATFAKGEALITPNGSWALPSIKEQKPDFEIGTFAFPGEKKGESFTIGAGDLALSISSKTPYKEEANKFVAYMTTAKAMQKYYDVDGGPVAVKGVVTRGADSELGGLTSLAFTDRHLVWLGQHWNSENDFFTLTTNYLSTGDGKALANDLNAFFNPMKSDVN